MKAAYMEVYSNSVNFKCDNFIILGNEQTHTFCKLINTLSKEKQQIVAMSIKGSSDTFKETVLSSFLGLKQGLKPHNIIESLIKYDVVESVQISNKIYITLFKHQPLKHFFEADQQIMKLLLIIKILQILQIQEKASNKLLLQVKNVSQIVNFSAKYQISSKEILKLLLFEQYNPQTKVIISFTLQSCRQNIESTLKILRKIIELKFNNKVNELYTVRQRQKMIVINFNSQKQHMGQIVKHTNLSKFLTGSFQINIDQRSSSSYCWNQILIIPLGNRVNSQISQFCNKQSKFKSDIRLYNFFRQYVMLRKYQHHIKNKYLCALKIRSKTSKFIKLIIQDTIVQNVCRIATLNQKYRSSKLIIQKYLLSLIPLSKCNKKIKKIKQNTKNIEKYIVSFTNIQKFENLKNKKLFFIRKVQLNVRCYLQKRKIVRQLQQEVDPVAEDSFYQEMITSFNNLLNKCNKLREVEKKAYVALEVISVKNNTTSPLFSSQKILSFIKQCAFKFKGDEFIQKIEVTDTSIQFITNYRKSVYGIQLQQEQDSESFKPSKGCGYKIMLNSEGTLHSVGTNGLGELGVGDYQERSIPSKIVLNQKVTKVSCGTKQSICLTANNNCYIWGLIKHEGKKMSVCSPLKLQIPYEPIDIQSSNYNSFVLMQNKQVLQVNNRSICYKQCHVLAIPFQVVCIKSNTLQIVVLKKIQFSCVSLSLKKKKQILSEFRRCKALNKYQLSKIPALVNKSVYEYFNSHCITTSATKQNDDNNLLQ